MILNSISHVVCAAHKEEKRSRILIYHSTVGHRDVVVPCAKPRRNSRVMVMLREHVTNMSHLERFRHMRIHCESICDSDVSRSTVLAINVPQDATSPSEGKTSRGKYVFADRQARRSPATDPSVNFLHQRRTSAIMSREASVWAETCRRLCRCQRCDVQEPG